MMKRTLVIIILAMAVIGGITYWLTSPNPSSRGGEKEEVASVEDFVNKTFVENRGEENLTTTTPSLSPSLASPSLGRSGPQGGGKEKDDSSPQSGGGEVGGSSLRRG